MSTWISFEAMMFKDYINYVEEYFIIKQSEINNEFDKLEDTPHDDPIRESIEDYHQSYFDVLQDDLIDQNFYNTDFTQRFRYAIVIQLYSFLEKHLKRVLPYYKKHNNIEEKSLKGNYLSKANKILKDQMELNSFDEYNELQIFSELRNVIVHRNGILYDKDVKSLKKIEPFLRKSVIDYKETTSPKRTQYKILISDSKSLLNVLNVIASFLKKIDAALHKYKTELSLNMKTKSIK